MPDAILHVRMFSKSASYMATAAAAAAGPAAGPATATATAAAAACRCPFAVVQSQLRQSSPRRGQRI
eukprot:2769129-Alexandrium_andersonii.AAC.1